MKITKILLNSRPLAHLQQISDPPAELYWAGSLSTELFEGPCLAVVGSRAATTYGRRVTQDLAEQAARAGVTIVSGLALGIDSIAHRAALAVGGKTVAVLPSGLGKIYPSSHQRLAQQIVEQGGALVSEYAAPVAPMKHQFIARNRLIAGLCQATLVTQAAAGSGSLHTAAFAKAYNRVVLAVPGDITNRSSAGTNQLLRQGATAVTQIQDVLDVFGLKAGQRRVKGDSPAEQQLLELIEQGTSATSELLLASQLPAAEFHQNLSLLELKGQIEPLGGDQWKLSTF